MLLVTVSITLDHVVGCSSHYFGPGCWLRSYYFGSGCWLLFPILWIRLLVTVPIILDQAVSYRSVIFDKLSFLN